ncbi:unnamed protein product [Ilex paraguariensis]|uniref:ENTH domain-containing protein n=1 Tax=Ilex paraguariensis TaxID=185542 RepID=A0ABC8R345_9AQUA
MSGWGSQKSLRKALGAIKDTTTVSLAKVNSGYKELDIAIVKATNHVEHPAKEKYIRAIFAAVSATTPRADVAYCIQALARRLSKTNNWAVALKTLIVIHRALREVDPTFQEELINYGSSRSHMLSLAHFKDDSSPNAWDYSAGCELMRHFWRRGWNVFATICCFSLYLHEYEIILFLLRILICFEDAFLLYLKGQYIYFQRQTGYNINMRIVVQRTRDLDTPELLEQLPALQQLLFRVLACEPQGAAVHNFVIQLALSMVSLVALESIKIYKAISDGTSNLVDKFFEMQRHDALKALDVYRKAGQQAERLSEFYEIWKSRDVEGGERFIKLEQPPASFLQAMEEYVREAPLASTVRKDSSIGEKPQVISAIEYKKIPEVQEARPSSPRPIPVPEPVEVEAPVAEPPALLGLNDPNPDASELDEKNAMALAIVPVGATDQSMSAGANLANGTTGWELALVAAHSSNDGATATSKLAGGLDKLTLDSLYDDAIRRSNQNMSYNPWEPVAMASPLMPQTAHDPFYASNAVASPPSVQMAAMAHQQQAFMLQQQQQQLRQMMMMSPQLQPSNPFGSPYGANIHPYGLGIPAQAYSPYTGLQ